MEKRKLGHSNLEITPIGLGCWQFSAGKGMIGKIWATLPQPAVDAIVKTSLEGGINWFDTAERYGDGASEKCLAAALSGLGKKPGEVIVATKWMPIFRFASSLIETFPQRQANLSPFPVDLIQIHQPYSFSSAEKQALGLARLLKEQKVKAVGVSNFNAKLMRRVHKVLSAEGFVLASNQVQYSLIKRSIETDGILETAKELGVTIIAYSPLGQGVLTGRFHDDPGAIKKAHIFRRLNSGINEKGLKKTAPLVHLLRETAKKHTAGNGPATAAQVALNWLVNFHGPAVVAIPGASSVRQAFESAHCLDFTLSADELKDIDEISRK